MRGGRVSRRLSERLLQPREEKLGGRVPGLSAQRGYLNFCHIGGKTVKKDTNFSRVNGAGDSHQDDDLPAAVLEKNLQFRYRVFEHFRPLITERGSESFPGVRQ